MRFGRTPGAAREFNGYPGFAIESDGPAGSAAVDFVQGPEGLAGASCSAVRRGRVRVEDRRFPRASPVSRPGGGLQPADRRAPSDTSKKGIRTLLEGFEGKDNLGPREIVGVPYSILVPQGSLNLWVVGPCHSSDTKVHGSMRAQLRRRQEPDADVRRAGLKLISAAVGTKLLSSS